MSLHETRRLFNNFAFLTSGYFLTRLLTMLATLYATRALGPEAFGSLSFGLNTALVLSVFANLGLDGYLVLAIARNPQESNALLGDAIIVKMVVFPLALLAVLFLSLHDPQSILFFVIWMIYSLLHSYLILFWATFRGLERMEFQTLAMIGEAILLSVGEIFAVWLVRSATAASIAYLVSTVLAVIGGYALLYKMGIRPEYRWRPSAWKQLIGIALPFSLVFGYSLTYDRLPSILIALLSGERAAGWFNSVFNITTVLSTIPIIMMSTVFPFMARKSQKAQQNTDEISTNLLKYTTIIGLGLAIALFILAPLAVPLLFGDAYSPSIWILQVLAAGLPFQFLSITLVSMTEAVGQQSICARYTGYALALAAPVCIVAVWQWGYLGGTLAYVINNAFLVAIMLWVIRKTIGKIYLGWAFLAPTVAALGAAIFAYLLRQWPFYLLLPLATLFYIGILVLDGAIGPFEISAVRRLWQSWSRPHRAKPSVQLVGDEGRPTLPLPLFAGYLNWQTTMWKHIFTNHRLRRRAFLALAVVGCGVVAVCIAGLAVFFLHFPANSDQSAAAGETQHSLLNASPEEVAQVALGYTSARFEVLDGEPTVLLAQPVTKDELPALGLSTISFGGPEPPLMLVVVHGYFDVHNLDRSKMMITGPWLVHYIVYVYDLKAGGPVLTEVSDGGEQFALLLRTVTPQITSTP